jgi:hypothetical protein
LNLSEILSTLEYYIKFPTDKINAGIIGEPTSEVIANEKGIPKAIKFSAMTGTVRGEISK